MRNLMLCKLVEEMMIAQHSQLADTQFRRSMPKEEKIALIKLMYQMAIQMGAKPTKVMNL